MIPCFWTRRSFVLSVTILALAAIAVAASAGMGYPDPVSSAALGPDWQCTRLAFVLTTCRRLAPTDSVAAGARKDPTCPRRTAFQSERDRR